MMTTKGWNVHGIISDGKAHPNNVIRIIDLSNALHVEWNEIDQASFDIRSEQRDYNTEGTATPDSPLSASSNLKMHGNTMLIFCSDIDWLRSTTLQLESDISTRTLTNLALQKRKHDSAGHMQNAKTWFICEIIVM